MSAVQQKQVAKGEAGMRLDRWFKAHFPNVTHARLEKLLRTGQVRIDGARAKAADRLESGQTVRIPPLGEVAASAKEPTRARAVSAADAKFVRALVIHKDADVLVLNKPAGLAVQGGTGTERHLDGLLDALTFEAAERPRLVHRLDKDTSGVLLLARSRAAASALAKAFAERSTAKVYWALTAGVPKVSRGQIDLKLLKAGAEGNERMLALLEGEDAEEAKRAVTRYVTLDHAAHRVAWMALMPVTGRTHQLRAHMAALGTPIVGDGKYGGAASRLTGGEIENRLHLHARQIAIAHPAGGTLVADAPLPPHMVRSWALFGFDPEVRGNPFAP